MVSGDITDLFDRLLSVMEQGTAPADLSGLADRSGFDRYIETKKGGPASLKIAGHPFDIPTRTENPVRYQVMQSA